VIELRDLQVRRGKRSICSISRLSVEARQHVAITGPNGSGKSTLLRLLAGFEGSFTGRAEISCPRRERIYVHQSPFLFRGRVLANVIYGLRARGQSLRASQERALSLLERLGIQHLAQRRIEGLSGGEGRRVALARALVLDCTLLLLDEPFADLDDQAATQVREELNRLTSTTVLFTSPQQLTEKVASDSFTLPC
jgi:ABC-type nitrate/sulfonate/bicarbonate transport system ATPase subunit